LEFDPLKGQTFLDYFLEFSFSLFISFVLLYPLLTFTLLHWLAWQYASGGVLRLQRSAILWPV